MTIPIFFICYHGNLLSDLERKGWLVKLKFKERMADKPSYGWKDLLVDTAIVAIVVGAALTVVGSFSESFGKFLPFLQ